MSVLLNVGMMASAVVLLLCVAAGWAPREYVYFATFGVVIAYLLLFAEADDV